jgi:NAD(P)-dependent dehydrogenase (short-subunit alcohol dehydrogenase family)
MIMNFKGKTVMVTGSVRNTGLGIIREFAAAGAKAIINGRKAADTARAAKEIRDEFNVEVIEAVIDLSIPNQVDDFFDLLEAEDVKLDILVNNAVIQAVGYSFIDTPYELLEQTFKTNTLGLFHCSQRAAKIMRNFGGGTIVNVGSNTAQRAIKGRTAYIASKGAVDALTRAMAIDLAPYNIRVNTVAAGYIHSDRWPELPASTVERRHNNIPLGCECTAEDIAHAVMFMASDGCAKTTGTCLTVDGGTSTQLLPTDCDL